MSKILFPVYFVTLTLFLGGCDRFPKDSRGTLEKVRNAILRVGLSSYDPAADASAEPVGNQINFVNQFAKELHAQVLWVRGSQEDITQLLSHYELHMAIGGYTPSSPFKKEVTLTKPYYKEKIMIAGFGRPVPPKIREQQVLVNNRLVAFYVKQKGGIPVMTNNFEIQGNKLIAATEHALNKLDIQPDDKVLHELKYAVAVPMGENAFLIALEKFIDRYGK